MLKKFNPAKPSSITELSDVYEKMKVKRLEESQKIEESKKKVVIDPDSGSDKTKIKDFLKKDGIKFKEVGNKLEVLFADDIQRAISMSALKKDVKAKFMVEGEEPEELEESKGFWRLPKKVIGDDLFYAYRRLESLYSWMEHGNDFKPKDLDDIISRLQAVKKSAKQFNTGTTPPEKF